MVGGGRPLLPIIARSSSAVTPSEKSSINANMKSTTRFPISRRGLKNSFQVDVVAPTSHSSSRKARLNDLSYGIKIWTDHSSVLSQIMHLTEGQTDRILIARPCVHSMQRGKNLNDQV